VEDLSNDRINEIADRYLKEDGALEEAFKEKFDMEFPEILNEHHSMLIVASEVDSSTERIIKYLSDSYGVGINAATFQYFQDEDGKEYLSRVFLIEPSQVEHSARLKSVSKRKPRLTYEELKEIADSKSVTEIYELLLNGLTKHFDTKSTTRSSVAFIGIFDESRHTIFSLIPAESDPNKGLRFTVYIQSFCEYLDVSKEEIMKVMPSDSKEQVRYKNGPPEVLGFFKNTNEVEHFLRGLRELKKE
jgi:hypothetical protein